MINQTGSLKNLGRGERSYMLLAICYPLLAGIVLRDYFIADLNLFFGIALSPYVLVTRKGCSDRFLWPMLAAFILLFFIPAKTVFFIAALSGLIYMVESRFGKFNPAL